MSSGEILTLIVAAGVIGVALAGFFVTRYYLEKIAPKRRIRRCDKEGGARRLRSVVAGYLRKYEGRVIYSIDLSGEKPGGCADAVLIGWFGVLALVCCDYGGDIYVDDSKAAAMTQIIKTEREKRDNPFLQASSVERAINEVLRRKKVYRVQVEAAVLFTAKGAKLNIPPSLPYFTPESLRKALGAGRYVDDKGVDADKVAEAILNWR